jgi:arsenate reductase (thioredoxin)
VGLSVFRIVAVSAALVVAGSASAQESLGAHDKQVLFVCQHGNVKSLMAMSYFNRLAQERGLPYRAVSRGTAPDSTTVPRKIIEGLKADGFDVAGFHPVAVKAADVSASRRVVTIGVTLPADAEASQSKMEKWDDVPPAVDFSVTRDSLMSHVKKLVDQLAKH